MGEFVEIDDVAAGGPADYQPAGGQVQVGQQCLDNVRWAQSVDRGQGDDDLGDRAVGAVEHTAESVGGDVRRQDLDCGHDDSVGGVAEDDAFLLQRTEQ